MTCYCDECENRGSCESYGAAKRDIATWLRGLSHANAFPRMGELADAIEREEFRRVE